MRPGRLRAAGLALALLGAVLLAPPAPAQQPAEEEGSGDAPITSGPITRRPPEVEPPDDPTTAGTAPESELAPPPDANVVEVLDATVFEGVFAPYIVRDGREIPTPLTDEPGDPVAGRRLYHNFSRTGCSLCHGTAEAPPPEDAAPDAPPLHNASDRLTPGHIRLWIVAPATIRPETGMPSFHKPGQRTDPKDPLYGGPHLSAAEVEHLVAYLTRNPPEGAEGGAGD